MDEKATSTVSYLEDISRRVVNAVNTRDWSTSPGCVWEHFAPHSIADATNTSPMQVDPLGSKAIRDGPQQSVQRWREMTTQYPDLHYKLLDMSTDLHEKLGFARVFITCETYGVMDGVVGQNVGVFEWRRSDRESRWLCTEYGGMRGSGGL